MRLDERRFIMFSWHHLSLLERIRRIRYVLALLVVWYQLGVARYLADDLALKKWTHRK